jgi:hypothetical protein
MSSTRNLQCTEVDVVETATVKWREVLLHLDGDKAVSCTKVSNICMVRVREASLCHSRN